MQLRRYAQSAHARERRRRERSRNGDGDGVSGNLGFETTGFCTSTCRARERERGEKKGGELREGFVWVVVRTAQ